MKRLAIAFKISDKYAFMGGAAIESLLANASADVEYRIYVITSDMKEDNVKKMISFNDKYLSIPHNVKLVSAEKCDRYLEELKMPKFRGSFAPYYTLMMDYILKDEEDLDKILIVDADSIILGDLKGLCSFDFQGKPIAMTWQENTKMPNIPKDYMYCRSSLVYINLPIWRKNRCQERTILLMKWAAQRNIYLTQEEGVLSYELQNEIQILPLKYNIYDITLSFTDKQRERFFSPPNSKEALKEAFEDTQILHFGRTFLFRPHEEDSKDPNCDLWWRYCNQSPWEGIQKEPALPLTSFEKTFRSMYLLLPHRIANSIYIVLRRLAGKLNKCVDFREDFLAYKKEKGLQSI